MDAEDQRRAVANRRRIIRRACLVGRPHLAQGRARLRHHIRDAEAAADLDQLAARDDHLASLRERRQNEQCCGGIVIDNRGGLSAGETAEERFGVPIARTTAALRDVVLERRVAAGHFGDPFNRTCRALISRVRSRAASFPQGFRLTSHFRNHRVQPQFPG